MNKLMSTLAGWKQLLMVVLLMVTVLHATDKGPDAGNYTATDGTVYSFIDPAGGGGSPSVLGSADEGLAPLTLPFAFQFYGQSYTKICVSSNGLLYFVTDAAACAGILDFANTDLSSTAVPGDLPAIAPYWTDLSFPGAGAVYYQTTGTAGSRKFTIEWYNAMPGESLTPITFEAVLMEGSNNILFQYQTLEPAARGTVAIRDAGGNTNGKQIQWSYNANVLANSSAILFTAPSATATSVNTITTEPPGLTVTIDGVGYATPKVVSWVPGSNHTLAVTSPNTNGGTQTTFTQWSTNETVTQIGVNAPPTGITYTATFATQYQLTVTASPADKGNVTGSGFYNSGSNAPVSATAIAPNTFKGFSGDLTGTTTPRSILMNGPKVVTATFGPPYSKCDVSEDSALTLADILAAVSEALLPTAPPHDVTSSGGMNVVDVQTVINAVKTQSCPVQ